MSNAQVRARGGASWAVAIACLMVLIGCAMRRNPDLGDVECDHVTHICVGKIAITSPATGARTNTKVTLQVSVTPDDNPPTTVRILKDGLTLVSVPPPFKYEWDTTSEPEGSHQISAAADIGSQTIMATPITIWVDRKPPAIEMRTPAPNATNVALSDAIVVVFSEALDPSSVSASAIALSSGGTTLNAVSTLATDGKTVSVRLMDRSALTFPATITATVNPGVKDLAGNAVGALPSWSWAAPLWVRMPAIDGYLSSLTVDANEAPIIAALAETQAGGKLTVLRYGAGALWDLALGTPTTDVVSNVKIATDGQAPVVAWKGDHVRASRWTGSAWTQLGGDIDATEPALTAPSLSSIIADSSGRLFIGWSGKGAGQFEIPGIVASWTGTAWQALSPSPWQGGPVLGIDAGGNPTGVFSGSFGVSPNVLRYESGGWVDLDASREAAVLPTIAVDPQGRPVILTREEQSSATLLHVRARTSTGWMDLVPALSIQMASAIADARLVLTRDGKPIVMWVGGSPAVSHVVAWNGTAWDTTYGTLIATPGDGSASDIALAIDSTGAPTAAWTESSTSTGAKKIYVWKSNY